jgi:alkylation response protein AidB-like acyl-CoA dehydrogenase
MQFALTEDQAMIKETAHRIARDHLAPNADKFESAGEHSAGEHSGGGGHGGGGGDGVRNGGGQDILAGNLKTIADAGFMGLTIEEAYGGSAAGAAALAIALEEFGAACASTTAAMGVNTLVAGVISAGGTQDQKKQYLGQLASGETPAAAFCLTEPGAGSDPSMLTTRARMDGNEWVLNGTKMFISTANLADFMVVFARTDPNAEKSRGISCFVVDNGIKGLTVGKAEKKMGQTGSTAHQVIFEDCRIPASALLGELNGGFKFAIGELHASRISIAALALGIARAAMDAAKSYMVQREQSGKKLAEFQGLQWMLADRETELDAARLLTQRAAWLRDNNKPFSKQAAMAKLYAGEMAQRATYSALQIHGGMGYLSELPLERYARDARITTIYEGTSEIQRNIIAREILSEYL